MRTCTFCGQEIMKWQSYQIDGVSVKHLTCSRGDKPARVPGFRWEGDRNLMLAHAKRSSTEGKAMEEDE